MTWIEERKNISNLIKKNYYFHNSNSDNKKLLQTYKSFIRKWGENSGLGIIKRTKEAFNDLENIVKEQTGINIRNQDNKQAINDDFSLSTYLNMIPFPENPKHAKLINILLGGYDEHCWDALERFSYELQTINPPETYEDSESIKLISHGVSKAIKSGLLGRELRRNNKDYIACKTIKSLDGYLAK